MKDSEFYKERYFPTLDDAENLIESWRNGLIKDRERLNAVWVWANEFVHQTSRRYFGKSQNMSRRRWYQLHRSAEEHDAQNGRIMALLDMLADPKYDHRSAVWVLSAFRRRFAQIEAMRQLSEAGIAFTDWGEPLHEQSAPVLTWVYLSKLERTVAAEGKDLTNDTLKEAWEAAESRYNRPVTARRWESFLRRWAWYSDLKMRTWSAKPLRDEDIPPDDYQQHD